MCLRDGLAENGIRKSGCLQHSRTKRTTMTSSPRQHTSTSPDSSDCTQLLQLLARNPSAALKVFKFNSPNDEKPPAQSYRGRRPKCTPRINVELNESSLQSPPQAQYSKVRIYCLPHKFSDSQTILETLRKPKKSNDVLLSKEEIELKSKCVDDFGNFNFEAILPAVYWKCNINGQYMSTGSREGTTN